MVMRICNRELVIISTLLIVFFIGLRDNYGQDKAEMIADRNKLLERRTQLFEQLRQGGDQKQEKELKGVEDSIRTYSQSLRGKLTAERIELNRQLLVTKDQEKQNSIKARIQEIDGSISAILVGQPL
jgi:hypothetical protein